MSILDPQFGFDPSTYSPSESGSLEVSITITNGVTFQAGVSRIVHVNSADAGVPSSMQATGKFEIMERHIS